MASIFSNLILVISVKIVRRKMNSNTFFGIYFEIMRYLVNQGIDRLNKNLLILTWSLIALVITGCLSGIIYSLIVIPQNANINSIDELVQTNLEILSNNNSWIWYQLHGETEWGATIDKELAKIKTRIKFIDQKEMESKVIHIILSKIKLVNLICLGNFRNASWMCEIKKQFLFLI